MAIEIKAKVSLSGDDTKGLVKLRDALTGQFLAGAVLHAGEQTLPLGDRLWAISVSRLWARGHPSIRAEKPELEPVLAC